MEQACAQASECEEGSRYFSSQKMACSLDRVGAKMWHTFGHVGVKVQ